MEAVKISREFDGGIDLVVTDLFMPIIRCDAAVALICRDRPNIKVIYISGSAFTKLGGRVRSVLDSESELKSLLDVLPISGFSSAETRA
ncbi:MAG TPA: response regulator [Candidatus Sulfotelmatobacter sp.]|nr:response regulator [Candidatus Sulfotelmatobacter sp.]